MTLFLPPTYHIREKLSFFFFFSFISSEQNMHNQEFPDGDQKRSVPVTVESSDSTFQDFHYESSVISGAFGTQICKLQGLY